MKSLNDGTYVSINFNVGLHNNNLFHITTNKAHNINRRPMLIYNSKQSVTDNRCMETRFCTHLQTSLLRYGQLNVLLLYRSLLRRDAERGSHCAGRGGPCARGAVLETSSNWTIAKVFPEKSLGLSICTFYEKKKKKKKKTTKGLKVAKYSAEVTLVCVRERADGSGRWMCARECVYVRSGSWGQRI